MNLIEFIRDNNLPKKVDVRESEQTYDKTDEKILYIRLAKAVEGQDYLVLSRTLASKVRDKSLKLADAMVSETDEGYGLICPDSTKVLFSEDLW